MPKNKNALIRYNILDECFSNFQKFYTFENLLYTVNDRLEDLGINGISERQLRIDIGFMRDGGTYNAPIETYQYDGKKPYYRYAEKGYSINNKSLSDEDREMLVKVIETLSRFRGITDGSWMDEIISNLKFRFNLKGNQANLISFGNNEQLKGLEFLSDMIDATMNHQPLKIKYHRFSGEDLVFTFHTYHINQYNNRWYAVGLSKMKGGSGIFNIPLDRIVSIRKLNIAFVPNREIDFTTYFKDIIGVTKTKAEIETIKLRFRKSRFPYVTTKPIHNSQKVVDKENCIVTLKLIPNLEFYSKIFEFGPDVEVLEPLSIRDNFRKHYEECLKHYIT